MENNENKVTNSPETQGNTALQAFQELQAPAIRSEEAGIAIKRALAVFSPLNAKTIEDVELQIRTKIATQNGLDLAEYRNLYNVNQSEEWRKAKNSKGESYKSFEAWAKDACGLEHAQIYNAVKAGRFISEDGFSTILPRKDGEKDYTFTHLVNFVESPILFEDKEVNGKKEKVLRMCKKWKQVFEKDGKPKYIADTDGAPCFAYEQTNEEVSLLECLCELSKVWDKQKNRAYISPYTGAKTCKDLLKKPFTIDERGLKFYNPAQVGVTIPEMAYNKPANAPTSPENSAPDKTIKAIEKPATNENSADIDEVESAPVASGDSVIIRKDKLREIIATLKSADRKAHIALASVLESAL